MDALQYGNQFIHLFKTQKKLYLEFSNQTRKESHYVDKKHILSCINLLQALIVQVP